MSSLCRFLIITVIACVVGLGIAELAQAQGYMMLDRSSGGYLHGGFATTSASGGADTDLGFGAVFGGHIGDVADLQMEFAYAGADRRGSATAIGGGLAFYLVKQKPHMPGVSLSLGEGVSLLSFSGGSSTTLLTTTLGLHGLHSSSSTARGGFVWSVGPSLIMVMNSTTDTYLGCSFEIGGVTGNGNTQFPILMSASVSEETHSFMITVGLIFGGKPR